MGRWQKEKREQMPEREDVSTNAMRKPLPKYSPAKPRATAKAVECWTPFDVKVTGKDVDGKMMDKDRNVKMVEEEKKIGMM
jgi:hypothetical protein